MPATCHCEATDKHFTPDRARGELATYRRRGPTGTARVMLENVRTLDLTPDTLLDVGAGIGVLHHELLQGQVQSAVHVEAAVAYVEAARSEAVRRGHESRIEFRHGDFLALAPELPSADIVTLDRVVCCYPDLEPLVRASAGKARHYYALSFPHDRWYMRLYTWWQNRSRQRAGNQFRTFVHPVARIHAVLREAGFEVRISRRTLAWEVLLCVRPTEHDRFSRSAKES